MLDNPGITTFMFFRKLINTHAGETIAVHWNELSLKNKYGSWVLLPLKIITQMYWCIILLLSLVGIVIILRWSVRQCIFLPVLQAAAKPPLVIWLYYAVLHAIIVAQDRYHFPSIPFVAMLSGMTFTLAWSRLARDSAKKNKIS